MKWGLLGGRVAGVLLAFDTATPFVSVALHDGTDVLAEAVSDQALRSRSRMAHLGFVEAVEQVLCLVAIIVLHRPSVGGSGGQGSLLHKR